MCNKNFALIIHQMNQSHIKVFNYAQGIHEANYMWAVKHIKDDLL